MKKIVSDLKNLKKNKDLELYIYNKIFHLLIKKGKKIKALQFFLKAFELLKYNKIFFKKGITPITVIYRALNNIKPLLVVKWMRGRGRKMLYLPVLVTKEQQLKLSLFWLIKSVNSHKDRKLHARIAKEILEAFKGNGFAIKRKQKNYQLIKDQRTYLHLIMYKKK